MLYQFPTCGGLKFKILCAIWECQSFTKDKKGLGKIPHLSLVAKPLVTHGEFYFSPLVASPLRGEKSNPFFSSVKDWVNFSDSKRIFFSKASRDDMAAVAGTTV